MTDPQSFPQKPNPLVKWLWLSLLVQFAAIVFTAITDPGALLTMQMVPALGTSFGTVSMLLLIHYELRKRASLTIDRSSISWRSVRGKETIVVRRDQIDGLQWDGSDNIGVRLKDGQILPITYMGVTDHDGARQALLNAVSESAETKKNA